MEELIKTLQEINRVLEEMDKLVQGINADLKDIIQKQQEQIPHA